MSLPVLLLGPALLLSHGLPGLDPAFFNRDAKAIMVECADKARAAQPRDSRALADYGRIYLAAGNQDRALEAFKRAVERSPKDAETHARIAEAWLQHGRKPEALAAATRMAELAGKDAALLGRIGVAFTRAGFGPEGRGFMDRAYLLDPTDWHLSLSFGQAALAGRDPDAAAFWFRRSLTGRTDQDPVWKAVGLAYADATRPQP